MNDFPEKRRKRRKELRVSSEKNMEKIMHREVEKQRRQEMASLYASLRSLLPLEFIQGKRSTSDQLNEAVNYIKYLERNIKDMSSKRDDHLMLLSGRNFGRRNEQGMNENSNQIVIRPCLVGVEIVLSVLHTPLSSVLQVLCERGLCVLGCISSNVNDRLIHTLQAEVNDLALTDFADLKDTLTKLTLMK